MQIDSSGVTIYPFSPKPALGEKLNHPALITYYHNFLWDQFSDKSQIDHKKIIKKISKSCQKHDSQLVSYDPEDG